MWVTVEVHRQYLTVKSLRDAIPTSELCSICRIPIRIEPKPSRYPLMSYCFILSTRSQPMFRWTGLKVCTDFGRWTQWRIQDFFQGWAPNVGLVLECYWIVHFEWWNSTRGVGARPSAHPLDLRLEPVQETRTQMSAASQLQHLYGSCSHGMGITWIT